METIRQMTQRKYTELVNWRHGDNDRVQRLLSKVQKNHPEEDADWCIDKLWADERSWRFYY